MAADRIRDGVRAAAEAAARDAYGRLVAVLTARTCDIAAAEDAVSSAFVAALDVWPRRGIPDRPEAWLLTVARRKLIDAGRKQATAREADPDMIRIVDEAASRTERDSAFPDERLKLMFICAHPALDPALHTPLMLQTVLGFDAARIGSAFLVSPSAMGQRLVRAKTRLRALQPGFIEPDREEWPDRVRAVLHAIYAAYSAGAASGAGPVEDAGGLIREAAALARILTGLLPDDAEALGLLALILYGEARRPAARDTSGGYIPLDQQDTALWDSALIDRAETILHRAVAIDAGGRFVLEAAIQSAHCARAVTGHTDWDAVLALYDRLIAAYPTAGAIVARACALGSAGRAEEGLAALEALDLDRMESFQPYWAARGYLLAVTGDMAAARESYERAADLATDPAVRDFLKDRAAGS